ncbi:MULTISPECIES: hypothetical protein [Burkholderia]|uniref:hypothetical protein n=1 Tax=Burkholderia TaxID=32008 RepID=UPI00075348D9|nr:MULTISPECIES: hypothetical protein [Burkholderia]KVK90320.1 hypothetical protein WS93_35840 [Burkholderia cepacia]KVL39814.1 hypothetical protein WS96_05480 [Burkholderia sp. MSMB1835]
MRWFTYELPPVDFGWQHVQTVEETIVKIAADDAKVRLAGADQEEDHITVDDFLLAWERAKDAAADHGWEGDFRHDPVVFWVPTEDDFCFGFAFKQDNNGTTFVLSPCELPHLNRR